MHEPSLSTRKPSYWMTEVERALSPFPSLQGQKSADVAIVGGGFVGLWTALTIKEQKPDARVVVLEQDVCGGGASGRNGGFVMSWWPKIKSLSAFCSREEALFLLRAAESAITEIEQFCARNSIDAHFRRSGWLWTATTEAQMDAWQSTVESCLRVGHEPFAALPAAEVAARTGSKIHRAGVLEKSNATVQPAALVLGLRKAANAAGIEIFERTKVLRFDRNDPVALYTQDGKVSARNVVIATNAWAAKLPELAPFIAVVNSSIVVTQPIPERLAQIGWAGGEAITDSQLMVNYYRTTRDGRIAFGKGTGAITYGSSINTVFSEDKRSCMRAEHDFRRTYPHLADVTLTHAWSGPIDRTYDSLPVFGTLAGTDHIHFGIGWSGNGVGPSRIGGKILASLALRRRDEWSQCALVNRTCRKFPPEPIRYLGGALVRNAVIRKERAEAMERRPNRLDVLLAGFAPSGLEDKF